MGKGGTRMCGTEINPVIFFLALSELQIVKHFKYCLIQHFLTAKKRFAAWVFLKERVSWKGNDCGLKRDK